MRTNTVLISGASIAGPALAYWLHRHGYAVTVVERAPAIRPGGHAVDIRGVARDVCAAMGIMPQITRDRVHEEGFAWVDPAGRRTSEMPASLFGGEGIVAEYEILRGDLAHILHEATRADAEYRFGDRITALSEGDDGVEVTFRSGRTERYDLVIGADGIHSGVRALAFGPEERFIRRLGAYTAYFTMPAQPDLDPHWFLMHGIPGGRCAGIRPENEHTAKAMLSFRADGRTVDPRDVAAQKALLAEVFAGAGWRVPPCSTRWGTRPTSTSTSSGRCTWTGGAPAGSRCSATRATARPRSAAWAPAWAWWGRTCSPVSWPAPAATT
ncbi:FAD-dependent monooxygenase [Catellatospora bangladeshensis]|uniref:FAD-dependent monooxygenase n=1 Tax=Catellatospora bangladeshensis TaxID=310355 RepID=UPI003613A98C